MPVLTLAEQDWYMGCFRKICCYVESEEALVSLHSRALERGMTSYMITDQGLTEFGGVATKTCIAIGPNFDDDFVGLTDLLPLL